MDENKLDLTLELLELKEEKALEREEMLLIRLEFIEEASEEDELLILPELS